MKAKKRVVLYGLFERVDNRWVRLYPQNAMPKQKAVRVFQNALLAHAFGCNCGERRLKPVGHSIGFYLSMGW